MNDEFGVSKTIVTGSNGGNSVVYNLYSERLAEEFNDITFEEIIRLQAFLTEYIKKEQNNENR